MQGLADKLFALGKQQEGVDSELNSMGVYGLFGSYTGGINTYASGLDRYSRGLRIGLTDLVEAGKDFFTQSKYVFEQYHTQANIVSGICNVQWL